MLNSEKHVNKETICLFITSKFGNFANRLLSDQKNLKSSM